MNWTNQPNISFWSLCREALVSSFFQYLFNEAITISGKKNKYTYLLVLPPCSSTQWSMTQCGQYTIWTARTTNVGGHLLISNIYYLTALDLFLLKPLWKEQACSRYMQCFAGQTQMVSFLSESETDESLAPLILYLKHSVTNLPLGPDDS